MKVQLTPHPLVGELRAPASKSYAHRWLLAAYLAGGGTLLHTGNSADVQATLGALSAWGMTATRQGDALVLTVGERPQSTTVCCGESGSTLRFLLPVAAALGLHAEFTGADSLMARPMAGLIEALNAHGADIQHMTVRGKLTAGDYRIDASVSSQYVTGLLFALPLVAGDSRILLDHLVSEGYVRVTLDVLARVGVTIRPIRGGYAIAGGQTYHLPEQVTVEGDWSGAAFPLAAGALGGPVSINNLNQHSLQGDLRILPILQQFGADVRMGNGCAMVCHRALHGVEIDLRDIPDLAQIIAVVAAFAQGTTVLHGVQRLRVKESDRLQAIMDMLAQAHIACEHKDDDLIIEGGHPVGAHFAGGNDHRTVMSAAILGAYAEGASTITDAEAVGKSYPAFWQDYHMLGGQTNGNL